MTAPPDHSLLRSRRNWALAAAALCVGCLWPNRGTPVDRHVSDEDDDKVIQVYVIHRPLTGPVLGNIRRVAHSALLLRTQRGRYYTLEYMNDSKAHMTEGKPALLSSPADPQHAVVGMKGQIDGKPTDARWICDLQGIPVEPEWTAEELQQKMQSLMRPYSVWRREHCHTAQERLRRELRILR